MTRTLTSRALSVLTLVALLAAAAPTPGVDASHLIALATASSTDDGWASFKFATDRDVVDVKLEAFNATDTHEIAILLYNDAGVFLNEVSVLRMSTYPGLDVRTRTFLGDPPAVNANLFGPQGTAPVIEIEVTYFILEGTFKMLVWSAGDAEAWRYNLSAEPGGASLLGTDAGDEAFLWTSEDFDGLAAADAEGAGAGGHAGVLMKKRILAADTLITHFRTFDALDPYKPESHLMAVERQFAREACPCFLYNFSGSQVQRPGWYDFTWTGGESETVRIGELLASGAVARLPT